MVEPTATVTVTRRSPKDVKQRHMFVSLDGETIAELAFGQTASREVSPGPHILRAHNTLVWKTLNCDLAPGEHAHFSRREPSRLRHLGDAVAARHGPHLSNVRAGGMRTMNA